MIQLCRAVCLRRAVSVFPALAVLCLAGGLFLGGLGTSDEKPASVKAIVFEKELTIGVVEGDENTMFGKSVSFSVDAKGNFYVLDYDRKQIRKFGPDGKYLLTIGRPGQGPGEFQNVGTPRFSPDGNIYVLENYRNRVHHFSPDGKFLGDASLPEELVDLYWAPNGTHLAIRYKAPMYVGQGNVEFRHAILDGAFKPLVDLYSDIIDLKVPAPGSPGQRRAELATYSLARPHPSAVMAMDGTIYFGLSNAYAIDVYSPDAKKIRRIRREIAASDYTKDDKDYTVKLYEETMYTDLPDAARNEFRSSIRFPKAKPFFHALIPMEGGKLAILVDFHSMNAGTLDIFDAGGRFLGRVNASIPWESLSFKSGKAYCVRTDDSGYKFIERYSYRLR